MENKDKLDLKRLNPLRRNDFEFNNKTGRRKKLSICNGLRDFEISNLSHKGRYTIMKNVYTTKN